MTVSVNSTPIEAFAAFGDAAQVTAWLAEGAAIEPDAGVYALSGPSIPGAPDGSGGQMELLAFDEPRLIRFRWRLHDELTAVTIKFDAVGNGTLVSIEHDGLPNAGWSWTVAAFWATAAENLRAWLARGITGPRFDQRTLGSDDVAVSVDIDASAEDVFRAIIEPELIERWMLSDRVTIEPRAGGIYDIGWQPDGPVRIVELEPARKLAYSWRSDAHGYETLVSWELKASAGRTKLTLMHSGFAPEDEKDSYRAGWHNFLVQIKHLVEQGDAWQPVEWDLTESVAGRR